MRLEPILISLLTSPAGTSTAGTHRWRRLETDKRHTIQFEVSWLTLGERRLYKALSIALAASIIAAIRTPDLGIINPKDRGEIHRVLYTRPEREWPHLSSSPSKNVGITKKLRITSRILEFFLLHSDLSNSALVLLATNPSLSVCNL